LKSLSLKNKPKCRFCGTILQHTFVDLGMSPLCESYVEPQCLDKMEAFYPLHVYVCSNCFLVQLLEYVSPKDIFTEYAYFSSYSDSWLKHAEIYVDMIIERLKLDNNSQVVEIASNDGYLLQYFVKNGVPAIGIEPAENVAEAAKEKGISDAVENAVAKEQLAGTFTRGRYEVFAKNIADRATLTTAAAS